MHFLKAKSHHTKRLPFFSLLLFKGGRLAWQHLLHVLKIKLDDGCFDIHYVTLSPLYDSDTADAQSFHGALA